MKRYLALRLLLALPTLGGVLLLVFFILHLVPGDPVEMMLGEHSSAVDRSAMRETLGLEQPLTDQLLGYLSGVLRADFGTSLSSRESVASLIAASTPATVELSGAAAAIALALSLPLALLAAARPGSWLDRASLALGIVTAALPTFWLGPLLVFCFAVRLDWLPVSGRSGLPSVVLPGVTLGLGMAGVLTRQLRTALGHALQHDFVRLARAKGVSPQAVLFRHALRNAATATLTVFGLQLGGLLAGAIITETIFAWPGIGRLLVQAISARDYPVVQGCVLTIALSYVLTTLATDLLQVAIDPRLRGSR